MCGIIGYIGHRPAVPVLIEGLQHLEYRGYDSAGVAFLQAGGLNVVRAAGKLSALEQKLAERPVWQATVGIGHTRWATHGEPAERNAHPHAAEHGKLAIVHNGIIENFLELKELLLKDGRTFKSETDTEVLANYIEYLYEKAPELGMEQAFRAALQTARGAYAVVMVSPLEPDTIFAARFSSPLLLGIGVGEMFVASDIPAFLNYTRDVVFLENGEYVTLSTDSWQVKALADGSAIERAANHIAWNMQSAARGGYKHFMLKEIFEQPRVLEDCMAGRVSDEGDAVIPELDGLPVPAYLRIIACGTSYHAGMWARSYIEELAGIPVNLEIASEFRYRSPLLAKDEVVMVISQSGETADTLEALRMARQLGHSVIGLCNVVGSSVAREADTVLFTQAGPEISVASTKAMLSQMAVLLLFAAYYAKRSGEAERIEKARTLIAELKRLPAVLTKCLPEMRKTAKKLAKKYSTAHDFFYLGRNRAYALALEGALKLKEISYIHAEGYAAGEMKHGPIALIDPDFPTFAIAFDDELFPKMLSNMIQIESRQGKVIALLQKDGDCGNADKWLMPQTILPSFTALPAVQLFSYEMAVYLGKDVDQPRNLAKSVTVE